MEEYSSSLLGDFMACQLSLQRVELFPVQRSHALQRGSTGCGHLREHEVAGPALEGVHLGETTHARPSSCQYHRLGAARAQRMFWRCWLLFHPQHLAHATDLCVEMDQIRAEPYPKMKEPRRAGGRASGSHCTRLESRRRSRHHSKNLAFRVVGYGHREGQGRNVTRLKPA
jgi:hypothetical protein